MTLHNAYKPGHDTFARLERVLAHRPAARPAARDELSRLLGRGFSSGAFGGGKGADLFSSGAGVNNAASALGQKLMESMFDEMVAGALTRGRKTSGVLGTLFNLVPALAGR